MNVLIILGHPDKKSFNHAVAHTCISQIESNGHSVFFHDLYAENFNPLLHRGDNSPNTKIDPQIKLHCNNLINSDAIIIIHPNWWGQPPAIIKGWGRQSIFTRNCIQIHNKRGGAAFSKGFIEG